MWRQDLITTPLSYANGFFLRRRTLAAEPTGGDGRQAAHLPGAMARAMRRTGDTARLEVWNRRTVALKARFSYQRAAAVVAVGSAARRPPCFFTTCRCPSAWRGVVGVDRAARQRLLVGGEPPALRGGRCSASAGQRCAGVVAQGAGRSSRQRRKASHQWGMTMRVSSANRVASRRELRGRAAGVG